MAMTDKEFIEAARHKYAAEGYVEIDDNAVVSHGDDPGAYVQAWVWVPDESDESDESDETED